MKQNLLLFVVMFFFTSSVFSQALVSSLPDQSLRRSNVEWKKMDSSMDQQRVTFQTKDAKDATGLINEEFDVFPPSGWKIDPVVTQAYWIGAEEAWATRVGQQPYEVYPIDDDTGYAVFEAFNTAEGTQSLITPALVPTEENHILSYKLTQILLNQSYVSSGIKIYIETSTDGITWTTSTDNVMSSVPDYNQPIVELSSAELTYDLENYIDQIVYVRFRGISDYGAFWAVLDKVAGVPLYVSDTPELEVSNVVFEGPARYFPLKHAAGIAPTAEVKNNGAAMTSTALLNFAITPGNYSQDVSIPAIDAFSTETIIVPNEIAFTPTVAGVYTITASIDMDDSNPANNSAETTFSVTDNMFASDNGVIAGQIGINGETGGSFGNLYELKVADEISKFAIGFREIASEVNFTVSIYSVEGTSATLLFTSEQFTRTIDMNAVVTEFEIPAQSLSPGFYLFAVNQLPGSSSNFISVATDLDPTGTFYLCGNGAIEALSDARFGNVFVRVITSTETPLSAVNTDSIQLFPNPAKEKVTLNNLSKGTTVAVYDLTGRIITSYKANDRLDISLDNFTKGVYLVKIENGGKSLIKKLVIE